MGQPEVASGTWRERNRHIFQAFYETMGQHRSPRARPPAAPHCVLENSKSGLSRGAQDSSKISEKCPNFPAYGMTMTLNLNLTPTLALPPNASRYGRLGRESKRRIKSKSRRKAPF